MTYVTELDKKNPKSCLATQKIPNSERNLEIVQGFLFKYTGFVAWALEFQITTGDSNGQLRLIPTIFYTPVVC